MSILPFFESLSGDLIAAIQSLFDGKDLLAVECVGRTWKGLAYPHCGAKALVIREKDGALAEASAKHE